MSTRKTDHLLPSLKQDEGKGFLIEGMNDQER